MDTLSLVLTRDWLQWLLAVEVIGLAAVPLAAFLFRALPDRGYGLSKPLGLLLVAFINWWLGSTIHAGNIVPVLWVLWLLLAGSGLALLRADKVDLPLRTRSFRQILAMEEIVFLAAFVGWTFVRALKPEIFSSEKPMDFMLLQTTGLSHSFPPLDAWYPPLTVNYYYLGYAIFAMLGQMAGVDPRIGFDLSNSTIFALGCVGGFSLAFALTRRLVWGLVGTFFLMLAGDLYGTAQVLGQVGRSGLNFQGLDLWCSTRVIDGGCLGQHTITEFPIFSLLFADLHPHVMAIPFVLLVIAIGIHGLIDQRSEGIHRVERYGRLALTAIAAGALFAINSWDYPTYTLFLVAALGLGIYRVTHMAGEGASDRPRLGTAALLPWVQSRPDLRRFAEVLALIPLSLVFYLPYLLTVHSSTSVSPRLSTTDLGEMLTVMGGLLVPVGLFVLWRGLLIFADTTAEPPVDVSARPRSSAARVHRRRNRQTADAGAQEPRSTQGRLLAVALQRTPAWVGLAIMTVLILLAVLPQRSDLLLAALFAVAAVALVRRRHVDNTSTQAVLLLAMAGVIPLMLADLGFVRDIFSHGLNYRLNTVFKLYYQAWMLLAIAVPYALFWLTRALSRFRSRVVVRVWYGAVALLLLCLALYPVEGIDSRIGLQPWSEPHPPAHSGWALLGAIDGARHLCRGPVGQSAHSARRCDRRGRGAILLA